MVFFQNAVINPYKYFQGMDVKDMNDEIIDNELRKVFVGTEEKRKLTQINN